MDAVVTKQNKKVFLTSGEVARLLGCSNYWVNILINKGKIQTHRIGGKGWHRVRAASLEQYAEAHGVVLDWSLLEQ